MAEEPEDFQWDWSAFDPPPGSLDEAIEAGDIERVKMLLEQQTAESLNDRDEMLESTPLHTAAGANRVEIAELLIQAGAEINPLDYQDMTPLHWAAQGACVEVIDVLVRYGADLQALDRSGWTPLLLTSLKSDQRHREAAELLLKLGAPLDLLSALGLRKAARAREMLVDDPEIIAKTPVSYHLLFTAVSLIVKEIWDRAGYYEPDGNIVRMIITECSDILELLIARGAPLSWSYEALALALELPHPAVAEILLNGGANTQPESALHAKSSRLWSSAERSSCKEQMVELLRRYKVEGP